MMPPSPNCEQRLIASLIEEAGQTRLFHKGVSATLNPPAGYSHLDHARKLLADAGLENTNALRSLPGLPTGRWIIRVLKNPPPDFLPTTDPLLSAAILGLAGPTFYSPERPIIWTRERLARAITLHRIDTFYEN